ncbi:MAG: HAD family hydrolase [Anaeromyxobacter sp.]
MACRPAILPPGAPPRPAGRRPALLLDRDGVINVDHGYVSRPEDVTFVDGVFALCQAAAARGWPIVVVTNQAGIGRGYYGEGDFERLSRWMMAELAARGAPLAAVYWCPHHAAAGVGEYRLDCPSRKPGPGMLLAARDELGLDLAASALVGDKVSDLVAGRAAGVGRLVLLAAPGEDEAARAPAGAEVVSSLGEARERLFGRDG